MNRDPNRPPLRELRARLRYDAAELNARLGEPDDRKRRGMVLVMTMLMMAILSALGNAASVRTSTDLRETGAYRIERAAYRVSETGTFASVAVAQKMQGFFGAYVTGRNNKLSQLDMGDQYLDHTVDGSFGAELDSVGAPTFSTEVGVPRIASGIPGFEAGKYCFQTYDLTTYSRIGVEDAAEVVDQMRSGEAGIGATVTVGPVPCGL
jgi:hypothetical protein